MDEQEYVRKRREFEDDAYWEGLFAQEPDDRLIPAGSFRVR